jgi:hypothetical protein
MLHQAAGVVVSAGFRRMILIDAKAYAHDALIINSVAFA